MDHSSYSNIDEVRCQHIDLDWDLDFDKSQINGSATLHLKALVDKPEKVVLDTRDLSFSKVTMTGDKELTAEKGDSCDAYGQAMVIALPEDVRPAKDAVFQLRIEYSTSKNASGIQWLPKEQTDGKMHPYVFTQFQAIHARSALPCQDSPGAKVTYNAKVRAVEPLRVLMSALSQDKHEGTAVEGRSGVREYVFEQKVPMCTYLIALAAGDLHHKDIGPRSRVWTEKEKVEACAFEFSETEDFIATAESFLTPYAWGRYDVLILPGSFPYGGMENPTLTFVTPTLLAGDRSLADVVAHEIAHSWFGNLVTNRTWESFWLNEGFTVFTERKIVARMAHKDDPVMRKKYFDFLMLFGNKALRDSVSVFGAGHEFTKMVPTLKDVDPDDAFSSVPYENGSQFLFHLQQNVVQSEEVMENFMRDYVKKFEFSTLTHNDFKEFLIGYFSNKTEIAERLAKVDFDQWFYSTGMPPVDVSQQVDRSMAEASLSLAAKWKEDPAKGFEGAAAADVEGWSTKQRLLFLDELYDSLVDEKKSLSPDALAKLGSVYGIDESKNCEILFRYYRLCVLSDYEPAFPRIEEMLKSQGRMKYIRPLYRELNQHPKGQAFAKRVFQETSPSYHNIASKMIRKDLGL